MNTSASPPAGTQHTTCFMSCLSLYHVLSQVMPRTVAFGINQDSKELFFQKKNGILVAYCILSFRFSCMRKETSLWPISHPDDWWQPPSKLSNPFYKAKKVNAKPMSYPVFFSCLTPSSSSTFPKYTHTHTVDRSVFDLQAEMERHLKDERRGERLRSGVQVVIAGATNAGKSSLLNTLCKDFM